MEKQVIIQNKKNESELPVKKKFEMQKLNLNFDNIKYLLSNLNNEKNFNNNLPKDDISHEEYFEVKGSSNNQKENKVIKYDTSQIYNNTILTFIIENLPNIKEKENLTFANLITMIEIINEKQIGNIEILEKLFSYAENKFLELSKNFLISNLTIESNKLKEKEIFLNDIFFFFKVKTELGKGNLEFLNIFLEHYIPALNLNYYKSNSSLENEKLNYYLNNLYNILWLISISISNISESFNKTSNSNSNNNHNSNFKANYSSNKTLILETYDKNFEKELLLSEKAVTNLVSLLKFISKHIDFEKIFSLEMETKIRLYKSLLLLKLEGIVLNENLDNFLKRFKNFHLLNVQNMTTESLIEKKFEDILKKFKVNYEKEKKNDFCSIDFFIKPNIAIEINGPDHYSFGVLKGKDNMKKRALKLLEYKILNVSYLEFNNLNELENKIKNIFKIDLKKIISEK